jgi:hypothetical protein
MPDIIAFAALSLVDQVTNGIIWRWGSTENYRCAFPGCTPKAAAAAMAASGHQRGQLHQVGNVGSISINLVGRPGIRGRC